VAACWKVGTLHLTVRWPQSEGNAGTSRHRQISRRVVVGSGLVFCHFFPTHTPNPSLAPPGERGEPHVAACLKAGTLRLTVRWPQSGANPATSRCSQVWPRISSPALDFPVCRPQGGHADQALRQCQLASNCLQPSARRLDQLPTLFDGNAPVRTFFPPSKSWPNVAVRSPFRTKGGGEGLGERGGIQRRKNRNAAQSRVIRSISVDHDGQEISQTPERKIHAPSRTPADGAP